MNKLSEMIEELCPEGVEWRKLGEVAEMRRGTSITKKSVVSGPYPVISGGKKPAYYCNQYNREGECITVAGSGAGAGFVNYWNEPIFVCDAFSIVGKKCLTRYLYYCLVNMQDKIYATQKGGGVPHVHISSIDNFLLPLPPLAVQQAIVGILDKFDALNVQLEAEKTAREKQYAYYRDKLLTFESGVEWRKLGEVCEVIRGKGLSKSDKGTGNKPIILYGELYTTYGNYINDVVSKSSAEAIVNCPTIHKSDILLPISSTTKEALIGKASAYCCDYNAYLGGDALLLRHHEEAGYLVHLLNCTWFENKKMRCVQGTTINHLNPNKLKDILLPLPPLAEQERLVAILDKFDALTHDLTHGLPAEIETRKKQYAYYRDKLLSFKQK